MKEKANARSCWGGRWREVGRVFNMIKICCIKFLINGEKEIKEEYCGLPSTVTDLMRRDTMKKSWNDLGSNSMSREPC